MVGNAGPDGMGQKIQGKTKGRSFHGSVQKRQLLLRDQYFNIFLRMSGNALPDAMGRRNRNRFDD
jgi:hypothetical protein